MMKTVLKMEFRKLWASRLFWMALLIGCAIAEIQVWNNYQYVQWVQDGSSAMVHPHGLGNMSLLTRWLGADDYSPIGICFNLVLPLLAAMPFAASYHRERKNGYALQVVSRVGERTWLAGKWLVTFASGMLVIAIPMVLNLMSNALICPLVKINILEMQSSVYQGSFFSELYYTHPLPYILLAVLLGSVWGGICAVMGLMFAMFLKNRVLIMAAPLITIVVLHFAAIYSKELLDYTNYEMSPLSLMYAACMNPNPAWFVALYCLVLTAVITLVCRKRGLRHDYL